MMIICCGESLIDMLPRKLPGGEDVFLPTPGGAIFNTAIALGRLGEDVGFFSGLSTDMFGQQLVRHLIESQVNTTLCQRSPSPTTLAFVRLARGQAQYSFNDENTAGRMLGIEAIPALPAQVRALHFGAISLIPEPCGSTYEEFMRRSCASHVISFDPNIRPDFVSDEAAYRARLRRMLAMSHIIKISEEDLHWLEPGADFAQLAGNWIEGGAAIVILTKGAGGVRAITRNHEVSVPACPVDVVDTVGAGDTFNAGFLADLRRSGLLELDKIREIGEAPLRQAIGFGAQVAAHTVAQAGANPPWQHELD